MLECPDCRTWKFWDTVFQILHDYSALRSHTFSMNSKDLIQVWIVSCILVVVLPICLVFFISGVLFLFSRFYIYPSLLYVMMVPVDAFVYVGICTLVECAFDCFAIFQHLLWVTDGGTRHKKQKQTHSGRRSLDGRDKFLRRRVHLRPVSYNCVFIFFVFV